MPSSDGNLIVEGDNLEALKALLPYYGGRVKCIYIDPPYNTGNEKWVYNDNVNSPEIRRWLGQVVGKEDASSIPVDLIDKVSYNGETKKLTVFAPLRDAELKSVADQFARGGEIRDTLISKGVLAGRAARSLSPADRGEKFEVPVLALEFADGERELGDDEIAEFTDYSLADADATLTGYVPSRPEITAGEIGLNAEGRIGVVLDNQLKLYTKTEAMSVPRLATLIADQLAHGEWTALDLRAFVQRVLEKLVAAGVSEEKLTDDMAVIARATGGRIQEILGAKRKSAS